MECTSTVKNQEKDYQKDGEEARKLGIHRHRMQSWQDVCFQVEYFVSIIPIQVIPTVIARWSKYRDEKRNLQEYFKIWIVSSNI